MLGTESEFSICVSHALEIWNSVLPSTSAMRWLNSATSRVVMPRRERRSFSCSLGGVASTACYLTARSWKLAERLGPLKKCQRNCLDTTGCCLRSKHLDQKPRGCKALGILAGVFGP